MDPETKTLILIILFGICLIIGAILNIKGVI